MDKICILEEIDDQEKKFVGCKNLVVYVKKGKEGEKS